MVEGMLFGHRRGAFTGAVDDAPGLIEEADAGTLFLDEIGSLPYESQAKLLRVLETGEVRRLRETKKRRIQFRAIAAVQAGLNARMAAGDFRADLFHRLAGVVIELPPLVKRPEDLPLLATAIADQLGMALGPGVVPLLYEYGWPGNVRELQAALTRAARLVGGVSTIAGAALAEAIALGAPTDCAPTVSGERGDRDAEERERLIAVYRNHDGNASRAATALGISRATFYRRVRDFGIVLRAIRFQADPTLPTDRSPRCLT